MLWRSTMADFFETLPIKLNRQNLDQTCRKYNVRKMALFGSVLREDFSQESDVDVLVEFQAGKTPGWEIVTMADELSAIFCRTVDLRTLGDLSRYFRDEVVQEAVTLYEQD